MGYDPAEADPESFHGIGPFDKNTGETIGKSQIYSDVFGAKWKKFLLLMKRQLL